MSPESARRIASRESAAERNSAFLAAIVESSDDAIIGKTLDGTITSWNSGATKIFGYHPAEIIGRPVMTLVPEELHSEEERILAQVRAGQRLDHYETIRLARDGRRVDITLTISPIHDRNGATVGASSIARDITQRKRTLERLRESERRFRALVTASSDVVYRMNPDWSVMRNLDGRQFIADTPEPDRSWMDRYIHPADQEHVTEVIRRAIRDRSVFELEHRVLRPDGSVGWTFSRAIPIIDDRDEVVEWVGMASDVTRRKLAEESQRETSELFRTLADNMSQLAWMADEHGSIFWYNRRWFEYTGATLEQMWGWGWTAAQHPGHVDRVVAKIRHCFAAGETWEDTFPLRGADGTYRWFLSRAMPIRAESGKVLRWFGTNTDVTEQLRNEEALRDADRRKNEFLAILAHELRNPLAPIRNATAISRIPSATRQQLDWSLDVIERQTGYLARLLDDLLDVSRITRGKLELRKEFLELNNVIEAAIETARPLIDARHHVLTVDIPSQPVSLCADRVRLMQIVSNLLTNAAKYTHPGGRIELRARTVDERVDIGIRDNGIGIEPAMLPRVFEMFTQEKSALERAEGGLGIGLALVRGLVQLHGGTIEAHSDGRDRGSEFIVHVPLGATASCPTGSSESSEMDSTESQGIRILVADDNPDSAESLAMVLRLSGHDVHAVNGGAEAVEAAETFRPHVALLDIGMPEVNGYEAARRIRARDGNRITLIALTGWGQEEDKRRALASGFDHHLTKPLELEQLEPILARIDATKQ